MVAMVMPLSDGMDIHFTSLHKILRNLYDQMTLENVISSPKNDE